jgi:hypothetical protein
MKHPVKRGLRIILSVILALAVLAVYVPQPAIAQANCRTFHLVREDDTTPSISHTYGLKWIQIAEANGMRNYQKPDEGDRLCIPFTGDDTPRFQERPEDDNRAQFRVTISNKRITINLSDFRDEHVYRVKVRDATVSTHGWFTLDKIDVAEDDSQTERYAVPRELRNVVRLQVCLKDQRSNELLCRLAVNP